MSVPFHQKIKVALFQSIDQLRPPGSFYTNLSQQLLLHSLVSLPLLGVREIDVRLTWRSALMVVRQGYVVFSCLTHRCYTHCKAWHRKKLFDGGYENLGVAGDGFDALGRAEIILHVDNKKSRFESHDTEVAPKRFLF